MGKKDLHSPQWYINRELSWLAFNDRVLSEGLNSDLPLLERLKFLAIVSSNLDEFFMVRVAGLRQQREAGSRRRDASGMTAAGQLRAISERAHEQVRSQSAGIGVVLEALSGQGLVVLEAASWSADQRRRLHVYFMREVLGVLTPIAVESLRPSPLLVGLQLNVAVVLKGSDEVASSAQVVVVPVPGGQFSRFVAMPGEEGRVWVRLEDVILANVGELFEGCDVLAKSVFRLTRDGDVSIDDDEGGDLLEVVEEAVIGRRRRGCVRLELSSGSDRRIRRWLVKAMGLRSDEVYEVSGMLDATGLMELVGLSGYESLKLGEWSPQRPSDLLGEDDLWEALRHRDVLLFHPYESFEPVVKLVDQAADDVDVLAIKQTLYRTSGDSPIIRALARAAEKGKQVTVLVELKARFDEARNVNWARRLEDAGCHVIYGIAGLKTHAKALLVVRREQNRIERYVHLGTGNYNDKTARLYSDVGLMTTNRDLASDVAAFFNLLTGTSEVVGWSELSIAPTEMRRKFLDLIDREIATSTPEESGLIMAKMNSLEDSEMVRALYRASRAGVRVKLNVRGICCLRPGVKKVSETIEVSSIVDRFLEHARIYYFRNGGHEEVYLSSADWMGRNLDKRLELLFPVRDRGLRKRLVRILEVCFSDNVKSRWLGSDGRYELVGRKKGETLVRAQECFWQSAVEAAREGDRGMVQFRPLRHPRGKSR